MITETDHQRPTITDYARAFLLFMLDTFKPLPRSFLLALLTCLAVARWASETPEIFVEAVFALTSGQGLMIPLSLTLVFWVFGLMIGTNRAGSIRGQAALSMAGATSLHNSGRAK